MEWAVFGLVVVLLGFGVYLSHLSGKATKFEVQLEGAKRDVEAANRLVSAYGASDRVAASLDAAMRHVRVLRTASSAGAATSSPTKHT